MFLLSRAQAGESTLLEIQKIIIQQRFVELLANLDQVPETGALVTVSFPKPKGGSGFPARVFAICPR